MFRPKGKKLKKKKVEIEEDDIDEEEEEEEEEEESKESRKNVSLAKDEILDVIEGSVNRIQALIPYLR